MVPLNFDWSSWPNIYFKNEMESYHLHGLYITLIAQCIEPSLNYIKSVKHNKYLVTSKLVIKKILSKKNNTSQQYSSKIIKYKISNTALSQRFKNTLNTYTL